MREYLLRVCLPFSDAVDLEAARKAVADRLADVYGPFIECTASAGKIELACVPRFESSQAAEQFRRELSSFAVTALFTIDANMEKQSTHVVQLPLNGRRFVLYRHEDVNGNSGTGAVAEGIEWDDGECRMHWNAHGDMPRLTGDARHHDDLTRIHGHDGLTQIVWASER